MTRFIPIFIVMLPRAINGNNSANMAWIVGSCVNKAGRTLDKLKNVVVTTTAIMVARKIDL